MAPEKPPKKTPKMIGPTTGQGPSRSASKAKNSANQARSARRLLEPPPLPASNSVMQRKRKAERGGGDLTGNAQNRIVCKDEWASGHLLGDSNKDMWTGLSDELKLYLSRCVASITLCDGDTVLFSCSGIAMVCQGSHLTRFLTSASLVRALYLTNKDHNDLKIEVRHEGNEVFMGFVAKFDEDRNFAVVNVRTFIDVPVGLFNHAQEVQHHSEVLVVGRDVSGEMMVRSVGLKGDSRVCEDDEDLDYKLSKAWEGGPLISSVDGNFAWEGGPLISSVDGNFVGMNLFLTTRRAVFLPCGTIFKHVKHYWTFQQKKTGLAESKVLKVRRSGSRPFGEKSNSHPKVHVDFLNQEQLDLESLGYPKLPSNVSGDGMILVNTFEETFGDMHGEGVWTKFGEKASNLNDNVVALASFNGEERVFACTGFFIEWNGSTIILTSASLVRNSSDENKIVENLRIEVLLKLNDQDQYREGTLEHYSLHYNVALVNIKDYSAPRPLKALLGCKEPGKVVAVGRCFKSGALMAKCGELVSWSGTLDCDYLFRSTCKISKAGIGGPLVNFDGDVIGMNFYDKRIGTPTLDWDEICIILARFETKSKLGEVGNDGAPFSWKIDDDDKTKLNRWPVPMPCWCRPEDKSDDDDEVGIIKNGRVWRYTYCRGKKGVLF
ncbi:unnamed protein product [Urochloa decumbens]|uniref:Uncharacterized protein n=1 Tax=Urochloa decumbens TaxID=240449 RepID=A0ABC9E8M0_9POAL